MLGFLKQWVANASEVRRLQKELTVGFAKSGVNLMHLHPDIHKYVLSVAAEVGATEAISTLSSLTEMVAIIYPGLTQEQAQRQMLLEIKTITAAAQKLHL